MPYCWCSLSLGFGVGRDGIVGVGDVGRREKVRRVEAECPDFRLTGLLINQLSGDVAELSTALSSSSFPNRYLRAADS